ncbi:plasmid stabilization protein [Devosia geojensis]|uniref:Pseudoazurin n=1 Tax=Devosia geojensis TaxID=443610 RepID=A0A0F5FUN0_9HYPH|nr:pseudoazurin [Devosia geojensis]KKB12523.1 plasmid stabilization protein [Devosia geojensis]
MKFFSLVAAVGLATMCANVAFAADHEVRMVNKDSEGRTMQFEPAFLKIAPGDTVTFVTTNPGHNSESVEGAIPEGAEGWKGRINEEISVTFDAEGLYAYKCLPHFGMGMVGLIQVGDDTSNLEAVQGARYPGKAAARMEELLGQVTAGAN